MSFIIKTLKIKKLICISIRTQDQSGYILIEFKKALTRDYYFFTFQSGYIIMYEGESYENIDLSFTFQSGYILILPLQ